MKNLNLVLKKFKGEVRPNTIIKLGKLAIGQDFVVMAGPCSIESEQQVKATAKAVKSSGADVLRGGAYKPRTSPYAFQGLGKAGLELLATVGKENDLPIVSEIVDLRDMAVFNQYVDIIQIGARSMQNVPLLLEVAKSDKPILLKRGMNATIAEWLNAAEYILKAGNPNVILCERGIRTHETYTRNTLDLSAVAAVKQLSHLPVIVDPSHALGRSELIEALSLSAVMAGADGLLIEVHPQPREALSDAEQQLNFREFAELMKKLRLTSDFYRKL